MQNRVNSFTGFQPLKEVWLGDCYPEKFYNHLPSEVEDAFSIITEWTKTDLNNIQKTLESFNVKVQRPVFTNNIDDYIHNDQLLKPPITPRDESMTFGNDFYHLRSKYQVDPWAEQILDFKKEGVKIFQEIDGALACLSPPSIVRIGKDIYIDYDTHQHIWGMVTEIITEWAKNYRVHICSTGGHSDGVFCPVAPGIIVATHYLSQYQNTFPDWEVFHLPNSTRNDFFGNWHVENTNIMTNKRFAEHVEKYAVDWVGNYKETVFEANMLVIDQNNVLAIKENKILFKWLEDRGINVTLCDFRCRSFWDGGLHCLTTDIIRTGSCENYFPLRSDRSYLDWL
jgi:hypothetical protein